MKIVDCAQGSAEWHAARCGKVTASRVADIVRKIKSGGVSASRQTYLGEIVAEKLSGRVTEGFKSKAMEFGNETEDQARSHYEFMRNVDIVRVGLVIHPTIDEAAASPDGLVGDYGIVEFKCPNSATHIATLQGAAVDPDYVKQMQWQMACTGRQWCDYVSFDPRMPSDMQSHITRVPRDGAMIVDLERAVREFLSDAQATIAALEHRYRHSEAAE